MITIIMGKQGSGKSTFVKKICDYASSQSYIQPPPLLYDGILTDEEPSQEILEVLKMREILRMHTIIVMQPMPENSCTIIPIWLTHFKHELIDLDAEK